MAQGTTATVRGYTVRASGLCRAQVKVDRRMHSAGDWPTPEGAILARDRLLLFLGASLDRLMRPEQSVALGAASPQELFRLARLRCRETGRMTSRFIGVQRTKEGAWAIGMERGGERCSLEGFRDEEQAAMAYDRLALHVLGASAVRNFQERDCHPASVQQLRAELREERSEEGKRTSRFRGVFLAVDRLRAPFVAVLQVRKQHHFLGAWETEEAAALAVDRATIFYGGPAHRLNFPDVAAAPADAATLRGESRVALKAHMSSRFAGVYLTANGAPSAQIVHQRQRISLGTYVMEEHAAEAYDRAATELHGENARLNFHPDTGEELCGAMRLADLRARNASTANAVDVTAASRRRSRGRRGP